MTDELIQLKPKVLSLRRWHDSGKQIDSSYYDVREDVGVLLRYIDALHLRIEELKRAAKAD